jgi:uncharacterized protein YyaL (SSP411 family)
MPNRLQNETSPYLLQHVDNPVDWYPWCEEALQRAKDEDKPIFLSIGYAACHWCHVMAHESFEDPETAQIMNDLFINIKVDREERPDLDSLYMDAVVAITGQGGWPMSVFLTPEGKPFHGGTYFPPAPRFNMPSFKDVLRQIAKLWDEEPERLIEISNQLGDRIQTVPSLIPTDEDLDPKTLDRAMESLFRLYDWKNGGWGRAPKFPQSMVIEFLFRRYHRNKDKLSLEMATHTLKRMAKGGMYDLIGGGFHRYAVDDQWLVPHFEKMLYDNALLIQSYLQAWQITEDPEFRQVAFDSLSFLKSEMLDESGGFYSSLDADSEGEEGKFYVWSLEEIQEVLKDPEVIEIVTAAYGLSEKGNFEGKNIPTTGDGSVDLSQKFNQTTDEIYALLRHAKSNLLKYRQQRVRPGLDDKILTAWNGLLLSTFSSAARIFHSEEDEEVALRLGEFLLTKLNTDEGLMRSWRQGKARFTAYLEDHAAMGLGLLNLYQLSFEMRWFNAAVDQAEEILTHFVDPNGGFFDTRDDHETLIARPKSIHDSPTPSGNTLAITLLQRLGALTGDPRYREPAESALQAIQEDAGEHPTAFAGWLCELDFALGPQLQLAIAGEKGSNAFEEFTKVANDQYLPNLVMAGGDPKESPQPALMVERQMVDGKSTAYLCQGFTCKLPTSSPTTLKKLIQDTFTENN